MFASLGSTAPGLLLLPHNQKQLDQHLPAENRKRLLVRNGVLDAASDVQIATIHRSPDARDYCMDVRDIANLKQQVDFEKYMFSTDDGQSLASKVCVRTCMHASQP